MFEMLLLCVVVCCVKEEERRRGRGIAVYALDEKNRFVGHNEAV